MFTYFKNAADNFHQKALYEVAHTMPFRQEIGQSRFFPLTKTVIYLSLASASSTIDLTINTFLLTILFASTIRRTSKQEKIKILHRFSNEFFSPKLKYSVCHALEVFKTLKSYLSEYSSSYVYTPEEMECMCNKTRIAKFEALKPSDITLKSSDGTYGIKMTHELLQLQGTRCFTIADDADKNNITSSLSADSLFELKRFVYTGRILFNDKTCLELVCFAQKNGIENLKGACSDYLSQRLNQKNLGIFLSYGVNYNLPSLLYDCFELMEREKLIAKHITDHNDSKAAAYKYYQEQTLKVDVTGYAFSQIDSSDLIFMCHNDQEVKTSKLAFALRSQSLLSHWNKSSVQQNAETGPLTLAFQAYSKAYVEKLIAFIYAFKAPSLSETGEWVSLLSMIRAVEQNPENIGDLEKLLARHFAIKAKNALDKAESTKSPIDVDTRQTLLQMGHELRNSEIVTKAFELTISDITDHNEIIELIKKHGFYLKTLDLKEKFANYKEDFKNLFEIISQHCFYIENLSIKCSDAFLVRNTQPLNAIIKKCAHLQEIKCSNSHSSNTFRKGHEF